MSRPPSEIRHYARTFDKTAINVLAGIMRSKRSSNQNRIAAAIALLDRGHGKPVQAHEGTDGPPIAYQVTAIEHTIVRPENGKAKTKDG